MTHCSPLHKLPAQVNSTCISFGNISHVFIWYQIHTKYLWYPNSLTKFIKVCLCHFTNIITCKHF